MLPSFVAGETTLPQGVYNVWCEDGMIFYNDEKVSFHTLLKSEQISYNAALRQ